MLRRLYALFVVLVLGCVLLAACGPSNEFEIDDAFTPSESEEISRAALAWNRYLLPEYRIAIVGTWQIQKKAPPGGWNGWCSRSREEIRIHPDATDRGATIYEVAVHEFGHSRGLGHTKTGLMMQYVVSSEFTPEVLAECTNVGACP